MGHDFAGFRMHNILEGVAAFNTFGQIFNDLTVFVDGCNLITAGGSAVFLTDNNVLADVDKTTGQVTGVRCSQGRIGKTFTGTMGGGEKLEYVQTFTEVGADRQLDDHGRSGWS